MMRPLNTDRISARIATNDVLRNGSVRKLTALRNANAMHEHHLSSSALLKGYAHCCAKCWGVVYFLPNLHRVALLFVQIGGQL